MQIYEITLSFVWFCEGSKKKEAKVKERQVRTEVRSDFSEVMIRKLRVEGLEREEVEGISKPRECRYKSCGTGKRDAQGFERPPC